MSLSRAIQRSVGWFIVSVLLAFLLSSLGVIEDPTVKVFVVMLGAAAGIAHNILRADDAGNSRRT